MAEALTSSLSVLGAGIAIVVSLMLIAVFCQRIGARFGPKDGLPEAERARVIARREHIGRDDQGCPFTQYFITFELSSGERTELEITAEHFGLIVEGDQGKLRFEDRRFISFERK